MPTLQFKGKNIIWNHHMSIPFHTLDEMPKLDFQADKGEENLIIEGDNLLALKALLPQYTGKVNCIYIDPPYNTGNDNGQGKGWVYNDNVNSPLLREWFKKEVGEDDLTRHDKWLCMIVPRLKLLRELLADDGAIFINIDDNEQHSLRMIMDELFGENNFVATIVWQKKQSPQNDATYFSDMHDFIHVYAKNAKENKNDIFGWKRSLFERTGAQEERYQNPDNDLRGPWASVDYTCNKTVDERPNLYYPIFNPKTKEQVFPSKQRVWLFEQNTHKKNVSENRIWWGNNGNNFPRLKRFLSEVQKGVVPSTWWSRDFAGDNQEAKREIRDIFKESEINFETPKPTTLIKKIIQIASSENDFLILDSFAGSGTTMHAVMDLNKEDGGNRKCILIQMTEATEADPKKNICKDITRERVKRAIEKYGYDSGFKYLKIGIPIDPESMLSGNLPTYKQFAKYVYYLCTGGHLQDENRIDEKSFFVGTFRKEAIYLVYKQDYDALTRLALNLPLAERITKEQKGKKCIVYAPACFLEEDYLKEKDIEYVGIPYNLFKRNGR